MGTGLGQNVRDRSCLSAFLSKLSSCLPSRPHDNDRPQLRSSADALIEPHLELKCSTPQMQSHLDHGRMLCSLLPEGCPARAEAPPGLIPRPHARLQPPGTRPVSLRLDGCIRVPARGPRGGRGRSGLGSSLLGSCWHAQDLQAGGSWLKGVLWTY